MMNDVARFNNMTLEEQERYIRDVDDEVAWRLSVRDEKRRAVKRSYKKGRAEGKAEGIAEGVAKGKTEGIADEKHRNYIELLNMAKEMKLKNYPLADIMMFTKLSQEEIEAL
jgi:flagellar biosynthesis/type III secretory pathway protein FliH